VGNRALLYVEDDFLSREAMDLVLRRVMGIQELWMFEDSAEFMARVKALPRKPDAVLLDINVKPHNGFELLKMLRSEPGYQDMIAIALTASVMTEEIDALRTNGFNGAIGKPIDVSTFPGLLERAMQGEAIWSVAA